jgi:hypothetical protein
VEIPKSINYKKKSANQALLLFPSPFYPAISPGFFFPMPFNINPVGPWLYPIAVAVDIIPVPPHIIVVYPNIMGRRCYWAINFYIGRLLFYITYRARDKQ